MLFRNSWLAFKARLKKFAGERRGNVAMIFALALAITCLGVVLYNVGLSSVAAALLVLSLARRAPETA